MTVYRNTTQSLRKIYKWIPCLRSPIPPTSCYAPLLPHPTPDPLQQCEYKVVWLEEIHNHCPFSSQLLERHIPSLKMRLCSTTPHARRERMEAAQKMKEAPQGRASKQEQKGTPCKPGPRIRAQPHLWGLRRQVINQG